MDVRFINPFVKSICNTFETMCALPVSVGRPQLKTDGDDDNSDVSAVIGFSGGAAGSVVLGFDFDTACKAATRFAGTEIDAKHPDFADALGELANMVAGGAKSQFEGLNISISLPNVIVGPNHVVSASKTTPKIVFPCTTEVGTLHVEVGMVLNNSAPAVGMPQAAGVQA
jgi:chemotaxis protein CheX